MKTALIIGGMCAAVLVVILAVSAIVEANQAPQREYTAYVSSLLVSDVTWVVLVDGEVTDRGTIRGRPDSDQPFQLLAKEGQRVSFTVSVVGTGLAGCKVERVADRAQVVSPVNQEPQIDRAPVKSPPVTCEFVA